MTRFALLLALLFPAGQDTSPPELDALRAAYVAASTGEERIAALEALAAADEPDAPSRTVAEAVAAALEDEGYLVRARAVELLARMHREVAVEALRHAATRQTREEREVREHVEELLKANESRRPSKDSWQASLDELRAAAESYEAVSAYLESKQGIETVREALVSALASLPCDASVDGLAQLLGDSLGEPATPILEVLIGFGSVNALEPIVARFTLLERKTADRKKELKKLERAKPGKKPSELWDDDVWWRHEQARIDKQVAGMQRMLAEYEAWGTELSSKLERFAEARGLPRTPSTLSPANNWRSWLRRSRQALPARLDGAADSRD